MSAQNKPECEIYKKKPECEFSQSRTSNRKFHEMRNACYHQFGKMTKMSNFLMSFQQTIMPFIIPGTRVEVNKIKAYSLKKN